MRARPWWTPPPGSTAISEAWFARLLGLPFIAVMPAGTAPGKVRDVQALGGRCDLVDDPAEVLAAANAARGARRLLPRPVRPGRARDRLARQQQHRRIDPRARWRASARPSRHGSSAGAGTGGTSATIGRYLRYRRLPTRLCLAEPTGSAFVEGWRRHDRHALASRPTVIEGIGRPRVEPGFVFEVVDRVLEVPDAASIAAAWCWKSCSAAATAARPARSFVACLRLAAAMRARGERGSIVSLLCDRGERYAETLFDRAWLRAHGIDTAPWEARLRAALGDGRGFDVAPG